tara:strand:+ start:275 stop:862 length:588 start_codon:yes stop_codon:yes gene_type:complete
MSLKKCDNCFESFKEDELENHKLYCLFTIKQEELENLIPCEICDELIDISNYEQHMYICMSYNTLENEQPISSVVNLNPDEVLNNILQIENFLNILNGTDNASLELDGPDELLDDIENSSYDELLELDKNNVSIGIKNIEIFITKKEEQIKCPICTDKTNIIGETQCGHKFCYECIEEWLTDNKKCPVCMIEFIE